jgi:hypothetical protein
MKLRNLNLPLHLFPLLLPHHPLLHHLYLSYLLTSLPLTLQSTSSFSSFSLSFSLPSSYYVIYHSYSSSLHVSSMPMSQYLIHQLPTLSTLHQTPMSRMPMDHQSSHLSLSASYHKLSMQLSIRY